MSETFAPTVLTEDFKYKEILISEQKFLIGICKKNYLRHVLLTNSREFYEDNLSKDDILKRCEELNKILVGTEFEDVEEIVDDLLVDIPKYATSTSIDKIRLENKVDGVWIKFEINLKKCNSEIFKDNFMDNLCFSFSELHHRYNCLLDIIKKKDEEIDEYKAEGIEILRKSAITEPFTESIFQNVLRDKKSIDKLNIFLDIISFYNSIKNLQSNSNDVRKEVTDVQPDLCVDKVSSESVLPRNRLTTKRPSDSHMRRAVSPKSRKKATNKSSKNDDKFLYLL